MFGFKFDSKEKIIKAKIQLQRKSPFFAHLIMNMSFTEDEKISTIGVNYQGQARYNSEFIDSLTPLQLKGVLCHEVMHVALTHLTRLGKRDMQIWNIATDMLINSMILKDDFHLPEEGLIPDNYQMDSYTLDLPNGRSIKINVADKVAEQIYEELQQKLPKCQCSCHGGTDGDQCSQGDQEDQDGQSDQGDQGDQSNEDSSCCDCPKYGFDVHEYGKDLSEAEKQSIEKEWKRRLVEAGVTAKAKGNLPGHLERLIDELLHPKLNWKALLYQYITKDILYNFTYSRPGKRSYSTGIYMPSEIKENLNIVVTIDTSGSISKDEYTEFMSEVIGIANAFEQINMDVLHWDTDVRKETKITRNNQKELIEGKIPGGGGTHMSCLGDYYKSKQTPMFMVHLTDGYIESNPRLPNCKHLFVISKHGTKNYLEKKGTVISIEDSR